MPTTLTLSDAKIDIRNRSLDDLITLAARKSGVAWQTIYDMFDDTVSEAVLTRFINKAQFGSFCHALACTKRNRLFPQPKKVHPQPAVVAKSAPKTVAPTTVRQAPSKAAVAPATEPTAKAKKPAPKSKPPTPSNSDIESAFGRPFANLGALLKTDRFVAPEKAAKPASRMKKSKLNGQAVHAEI